MLKERNTLRRLFNFAIEKEKLFQNPAAGPAFKKQVPKQPPGRVAQLTPEQWNALVAACYIPPTKENPQPVQWLQQFATLSVNIATRRGELLAVHLPEVFLDKGYIWLTKTKNGEPRAAWLNDEAYKVLAEMGVPERIERGDRGPLFSGFTPEQLSMKFLRAAKRAGLAGFHLHDTRHVFASASYERTKDAYATQLALGHKDPRMMQRYTHLKAEQVAAASASISGSFALPGKTIEGEVVKALPAPAPEPAPAAPATGKARRPPVRRPAKRR